MMFLSERNKEHVLSVWLTFVMLAAVKIRLSPLVPWGATVFVYLLFLPALLSAKIWWRDSGSAAKKGTGFFLAGMILFALMILWVGALHGQGGQAATYSLKYMGLTGCFALFVLARVGPVSFVRALTLSLFVNAALLLGGIVSGHGIEIWKDRRIGLYLNEPGTLWKVGGFLFIYFGYRLLDKGGGWRDFLLASLCLLMAGLDGSRSGLVVITVGYALLFLCYAFQHRRFPAARKAGALLLALPLGLWLLPLACDAAWNGLHHSGAATRGGMVVERFLDIAQTNPAPNGGREANNVIRTRMVAAGIDAMRPNFFDGGGIGHTTVPTGADSEVVHITFLQIWGDYGLVALAGFLSASLAFLFPARSYIAGLGQGGGRDTGETLTCLFVMIGYLFYGLFNPLSNEPSEWGLYILALAALVNHTRKDDA